MYASPVIRTTSQLSQPSSSISARVVGRNGAIPNRFAQYGRYENSPRGAGIAATVSTPAPRAAFPRAPYQQSPEAAPWLLVAFLGLGRVGRGRTGRRIGCP